ncbi:BPI fold-containing family A member 2 [Alexandromys fortis]|uniref:BPI fold-containing family A member 2 n=1 Tax=Alexandromys fortis TaxID=100897 RepID=UPI00215254AA|nr:BPI fold-containing family A member 2 [Microtus fortis]XP_050006701.1 BPI fold-containing family A member 2 [Microtus fortis]
MFQLGSLIVLCGLLSGTSASLSDVLQDLNLDLASLQEALNLQSIKDNILGSLKTLDLLGLQVKINELNIVDVQASSSSDGNAINLQLPVRANVSVFLPLLGSTVDVAVSLDVINSLAFQTNAQTGLPTLAVGECLSDTDNISISLLGRRSALLNRLLDEVSGLLTNVVSNLLQNQLCPLLQSLISGLDVNILQNLLSNLQLPASL